jgi:hypothetical protein
MGGLSAGPVLEAELQLAAQVKQKQRHDNEQFDIEALPYT